MYLVVVKGLAEEAKPSTIDRPKPEKATSNVFFDDSLLWFILRIK